MSCVPQSQSLQATRDTDVLARGQQFSGAFGMKRGVNPLSPKNAMFRHLPQDKIARAEHGQSEMCFHWLSGNKVPVCKVIQIVLIEIIKHDFAAIFENGQYSIVCALIFPNDVVTGKSFYNNAINTKLEVNYVIFPPISGIGVEDKNIRVLATLEEIIVTATLQSIIAIVSKKTVLSARANQLIVADATVDHVIAGTAADRVCAATATQLIRAIAAKDFVVTVTALDRVCAVIATQVIRATAAQDFVVPLATGYRISATARFDRIICVATDHRVSACCPDDPIPQVCGMDFLYACE